MLVDKFGTRHYQDGDDINRIELRYRIGLISPRYVALISTDCGLLEAELPTNIRRIWMRSAQKDQDQFNELLLKHRLEKIKKSDSDRPKIIFKKHTGHTYTV